MFVCWDQRCCIGYQTYGILFKSTGWRIQTQSLVSIHWFFTTDATRSITCHLKTTAFFWRPSVLQNGSRMQQSSIHQTSPTPLDYCEPLTGFLWCCNTFKGSSTKSKVVQLLLTCQQWADHGQQLTSLEHQAQPGFSKVEDIHQALPLTFRSAETL